MEQIAGGEAKWKTAFVWPSKEHRVNMKDEIATCMSIMTRHGLETPDYQKKKSICFMPLRARINGKMYLLQSLQFSNPKQLASTLKVFLEAVDSSISEQQIMDK
jgi:hypothetical protein